MQTLLRSTFFVLLVLGNVEADELVIDKTNIGKTAIILSEYGGSGTIITENDIALSGATDVQQLLRQIPGLAVFQSGARGGKVSIFSRGSESDHNLVLIDGVIVNDIGGVFDFSNLTTNNIEKIEILKGPQTVLYGAGAMGLVVNIITKKATEQTNISLNSGIGFGQEPKRKDQSNGGTYLINEQSIAISGPANNNIGYSVGFERIDNNGHMLVQNNYDNRNLNGGISLYTDDEKIRIIANMANMKRRFRYPTNSSGVLAGGLYNTQKERVHTNRRSIKTEYDIIKSLTLSGIYTYWHKHLWTESVPDQNWWETRKGFDYYMKTSGDVGPFFVKSLFGYRRIKETSDYNRFGGAYYGHKDITQSYYSNVVLETPYELFINPGIRKEKHETHGSTVIPSIFVSKNIFKLNLRLRGGYSKGIKYAGIYESYDTPGLKPEKNKAYEIGFDKKINQNISVSGTYFRTLIYDLIAYKESGSSNNYKNIQEAQSKGLEVFSNVFLPRGVRTKLWYTRLLTEARKTENLGGSSNWTNGEPMLRRPKHSGGFTISKINNLFNINFDGTYTGQRWDYESYTDRDSNEFFWIFNLYADYNLMTDEKNLYEIKPFLRINNIFNDNHQQILNFDSPGRAIFFGLKANI